MGMFKENVDLNVNVSLADLVNGSFRLERGEAQAMLESPAPLELEAEEVAGEAPDDREKFIRREKDPTRVG